jgi:SOS-response transcriptional repressor LexA
MSEVENRNWINRLSIDFRINIWHKAIALAILQISVDMCANSTIQISRRRIMNISKIRSITTYHKYLKDLQAFGYIEYYPSYHPALGSKIILI